MKKLKKKLSLKRLKKKLDKVFSEYIRKRDNYICFTCDKKLTLKTSQCGHYVSRNYLNTRFDEENCHCQCVGCNVFKKGNMAVYSQRLIDKYGAGIIAELLKRSKEPVKVSRTDYEDIIEMFNDK